MYAIYLILSVVVVFVLQSTLFPLFFPAQLRPDLALLASVYFGLYWGEKTGVWMGFVFGIIEDSLSVGPLGLNAFIKSLLGFSAGYLRHNIAASNPFPQVMLIFAASLIDGLIVNLAGRFLPLGSMSLKRYALTAPLFAASNCALGLVMFGIMRRAELRWRLRRLGGPPL